MSCRFKVAVAALILGVGTAGFAAAEPFEDGYDAVTRGDYATAMRLWRPLAEQGGAIAHYNLGLMYYRGEGVPQNYASALIWFRKAADQEHAAAQYSLGHMYFEGRGIPQNSAAAAIWFRKAADQGDVAAQYYLGSMYFDGQDYVSAHMWFNLAATCRRENEPGTDCRSAEDGPRMESGIYSTLDGWCIARRRAQIHGARRG